MKRSARRGPWWLYLVVVGGLNVARQVVFPPARVGTGTTVALFFVVLAVGFAVVEGARLLLPRRLRD